MLPRWDKKYCIGHKIIDSQHKKLFELAQNVESAFYRYVKREELKQLLIELFYYIKEHCEDEEQYMREINYPHYEQHCKIHQQTISNMISMIKDIKSTNDLKEKFYKAIKHKFIEHIIYEDMEIAKWKSRLDFIENRILDDDLTFEECLAYYTCECEDFIHKVPLSIHYKIQSGATQFKCKKCKAILKFSDQDKE
ncbi:hemerythrin family non-heme iron protein [Campylobacter sp. TTU-622]|uniref:bacteriohemerythrin n=1 Tax=unclassified Campylobacter TaxID=2593542 RepID=UPI0019061E5B|nr:MULTISPECIES: hemerythrin family protein [unclassified Campylobacter]MBK1971479.1 hemerythrin family non-heme iron protein [Campylobacter sp. TTU_617]MBK1972644.1 hemerythrin family non-heme iron protein [Campylobacter sp. TTU-622]MBK1991261.1 hemerythrin family non-heme iron protein [Campylobacter sp. 2018MI34]